MNWKTRIAPVLAVCGAMWCVAVGMWLWVTPMRYVGITNVAGVRQEVTQDRAFSEVSGLGPLPLIIPAALAIFAAWAAWRGRKLGLGVSTLLFAGFTLISGFSIGANYVPAAAALIVATLLGVALGSGAPSRATSCGRAARS